MLIWAASAAVCAGLFLAFYGVVQTAGAGRVRAVDLLSDPVEEPAEYDEFRARLSDSFATRVVDALGGVSESLVRRLTPSVWHDKLANRLRMAGLEVTVHPRTIYVAKVLGAVFGLALFGLAAFVAGLPKFGVLGFAAFGLLLGFVTPTVILDRRAADRQAQIRRTLPEALDLMAISVQAGVGLEQAVSVVSERLPGALGEELKRFLNEVQLGLSRREALVSLRARTDCPDLSTFILSLLQADALGIAIGEVLKTQATEIRAKRRARARERAAKAPVRLLFPLIFGILPALFVVILGPAAITIRENFGI